MKNAQNNRNELNYQTVADILYTDACENFRKFGKPIIEISDYQVFSTIIKSRQPQFTFWYTMEKVAEALNKIVGCTAIYHNNGPKNYLEPTDWDEDDETIELILTETIR